jgi:hypothetical protein
MPTNFKYGLSVYGMPLVGPDVPMFFGANTQYYFVDGTNGSTTNSGERADDALSTIAAAITKCNDRIDWSVTRWANNDVIIIAPGVYAENLTDLPYGCTLVGLGFDNRDAQNGVKIKPTSGAPVDVDSVINSTFINIGFETADTTAGHAVFDAAICNNCYFFGCRFAGPAETATAVGFVSNDMTCTKLFDCDFTCLDKGLDVNYADSGDKFAHCYLGCCRFTQIDTAGIEISLSLVGPSSIVERCIFVGAGQTMAIGIDDNVGLLDIIRCDITATDPIQGCRSAEGCYGNGLLLLSTGEST